MIDNPRNGATVRDMDLTLFAAVEPVATGKLIVDWTQVFNWAFTLGMAIIGYLTLRTHQNSKRAADLAAKVDEKTDKLEEKADKAAETLKEVKIDVNSGRTKLEEKLNKVEEKLLVATGDKATADEKIRSEQDKAVALAATKVTAPSIETKEP